MRINILLTILLVALSIRAQDTLTRSFAPPESLDISEVPQLIVLGFDDNLYIDGMNWVLDLLDGKTNPVGINNPKTFDGDPIKATFYCVGKAIGIDPEDDQTTIDYKDSLLTLWEEAVARKYEIGNHTYTHPDIAKTGMTSEQINDELQKCSDTLTTKLNISADSIVGFRTPYLSFNQTLFDVLFKRGFKYECTVTYIHDFNKQQHIWPHTLEAGFPTEVSTTATSINASYPGMWEMPCYTTSTETNGHPPVVNFDSTILTQAYGSQFEQMLKNGLDYRLKEGGNRTPYTIGLHSDTYSDENTDGHIHYDPQLSLADRRQAVTNFINYALTKPDVRFVTAKQAINWMNNPVGLTDLTATQKGLSAKKTNQIEFTVSNNLLKIKNNPTQNSKYSISNLQGKTIKMGKINSNSINISNISNGIYFIKVENLNGGELILQKINISSR